MGYESRLYIIDRAEYEDINGQPQVYVDELATFNMGSMGDKEFWDLFDTELDFDLPHRYYYDYKASDIIHNHKDYYVKDSEHSRIDEYGKVCKYAPMNAILEYFEKCERTKEHYHKIHPILMCLRGLKQEQEYYNSFDNLIVVHFGC